MSQPRRRTLATGLLGLLCLAHGAGDVYAATAYVIDQLLVGIHEEQTLESAIIQVVPTGTRLEVLERNAEYARVRTDSGVTGWVDASYVTEEPPARLRVDALESELARMKAALAEATAGAGGGGRTGAESGADPEVQRLREALAQAQGQIESISEEAALKARAAIDDARAEIVALRAQLAQSEPPSATSAAPRSDELRELQLLAEENRTLKAKLAASETQEQPAGPAGRLAAAIEPLRRWAWSIERATRWQLAALGFTVLLAFFLGAFWIDYGARKRHGGFRI